MRSVLGDTAVDNTLILGDIYGVPYRNDNSYVLTYDSSIVSDEAAKTVEGIIEACKAAGATFNYNVTNSWYSFAPVWGAGGKNYTDENGDYHSEIATEAVAQAAYDFSNIIVEAGDTFFASDSIEKFGAATSPCGAVISWNGEANVINQIGAERTKCTVLPTFTSEGKQVPMNAFHGYKTWSMKKGLDEATRLTARAFCLYMASDEVAAKRVTDLKHGVPNVRVQARTELWTSNWVKAVNDMIAAGRTVSQLSGGVGSFWTPAADFGTAMKDGFDSVDAVLEALEECETAQLE